MGLDMYLTGEKYFIHDWEHPDRNQTEDGLRLKCRRLELGYWRKHPDLHGYIVENFANGVDNCHEIELSVSDIQRIILAIESGDLPKTIGFFFGESQNDEEQRNDAISILLDAKKWLEIEEEGVWKSVYYRASW